MEDPTDGIMPSFFNQFHNLTKLDMVIDNRMDDVIDGVGRDVGFKARARIQSILDHLPPKLTHLTVTYFAVVSLVITLDNLPPKLTYLSISRKRSSVLTGNIQLDSLNNLPKGLKHLRITRSHPRIDKLPHGLTHLAIHSRLPIEEYIKDFPPTLQYLELGCDFNKSPHNIPPSLTTLALCGYPMDIELTTLPTSLKKLILNSEMKQEIDMQLLLELPVPVKFEILYRSIRQ